MKKRMINYHTTIRYFHYFDNSWGWKELFLTRGRFTDWEPNEYFFPSDFPYKENRFVFKTKREPNDKEWAELSQIKGIKGAPLIRKNIFIL